MRFHILFLGVGIFIKLLIGYFRFYYIPEKSQITIHVVLIVSCKSLTHVFYAKHTNSLKADLGVYPTATLIKQIISIASHEDH